jgi:hypothetical protein
MIVQQMLRPRRLASCDPRDEGSCLSPPLVADADARVHVIRPRWAGRGGAGRGECWRGERGAPETTPDAQLLLLLLPLLLPLHRIPHVPAFGFSRRLKGFRRRLPFLGEKASEAARKHSGPRIARKPYCSGKAEIPPSALAQLDRRFDRPTDRRTDRRMGAQHSRAAQQQRIQSRNAPRSHYPLSPLPRLGFAWPSWPRL